MAQLLVLDYLQTHNLQQLEDEHGVNARPNTNFDKLSLNYDMIMVKDGDPLAEQCRGLVVRPTAGLGGRKLTESCAVCGVPRSCICKYGCKGPDDLKTRTIGSCEVLAWPMNRFYNLGDPAGAAVDWDDTGLRVYEKLDGTMIVCYWDPFYQRWFAGTRSVSEADLPIRNGDMELGSTTFSDLFFQALRATREAVSGEVITWDADGYDKVVHLNQELTYVFELTSPHNRVVVKYNEPRVTLIAARHTQSGEEVAIEDLRLQHVQRPKTWNLKNPTALAAFVNSADPAELEGCVVCDSKFRRIKVKNKAWILSSKAKDLVTTTRRGALEAIIAGTIDDVIPLVEESIGNELKQMRENLKAYLIKVDANFKEWSADAVGNRKRFAELVGLSGDWATPYFQLLDAKASGALDWVTVAQAEGKLSPRILDTLLEKIKG